MMNVNRDRHILQPHSLKWWQRVDEPEKLLKARFNKPLAIHANLYMACIFVGVLYRKASYVFVPLLVKPLYLDLHLYGKKLKQPYKHIVQHLVILGGEGQDLKSGIKLQARGINM